MGSGAARSNESGRFEPVGEVSVGKGKRLVVSLQKGRVVLGQKIIYPTHDDVERWAYLPNSPHLTAEEALRLRDLLSEAVDQLQQHEIEGR